MILDMEPAASIIPDEKKVSKIYQTIQFNS